VTSTACDLCDHVLGETERYLTLAVGATSAASIVMDVHDRRYCLRCACERPGEILSAIVADVFGDSEIQAPQPAREEEHGDDAT
jgi:hypothetical protein